MSSTTSARAGTTSKVRHWPATFWALLIGTFLVRAGGFAFPFLAYYLTDRHLSLFWVGAIMAAFGGGWLLGQLVCGWLADTVGHQSTLIGAMTTGAAALLFLARATSPLALLAAALVVGAAFDAHRPVVAAAIADLTPDQGDRAALTAWRHFAINLGAAAAGALGGLWAQQAGIEALLWANAAACAGFAALAALFLPPEHQPAAAAPRRTADIAAAVRDRRLWLLCGASLAALVGVVGLFNAVPLLMSAAGLSATAYGWTQVANAGAVLIISPLATPWLRRRAARPEPMTGLLAAGSLTAGAGMGLAGIASTPAAFAVAVVVTVPGEIAVMVAAGDLVTRIAPPQARGLYSGLWGTTLAGAVTLAPLIASWSLAAGGPHLVAATTVTAGVLGAAACRPLHTRLRTDHTPTPPAGPHRGRPSPSPRPFTQ